MWTQKTLVELDLFIIMLSKISVSLLVVIILIHGLIITKLIYFPYPELFIYPYLTNSGLKPYQQILDQHFPGLMFLPINFDNLGLTSPEIARIWSIVIIIINQILLFIIGKKLLGSPARALLINFLYLVWQPFLEGWVLWIDNFLPLFLLPAFYFLEKRILFSGLLIGIAVVFKQTMLPLSGLVFLYLYWKTKSFKIALTYLLGLMIPIILMIIYFALIGVLGDFWYWTIIFNLTTYAQFGTKAPPLMGFVTRVILIFAPAFLIIFLKKNNYKAILLVFLIGSLIGILDRADFVHFQPALPFAAIASVIAFYSLIKYLRFKAIIFIYIAITLWWLGVFYKGHIGNKVFFYDNQTKELVSKVKILVSPKERIFAFGVVPSFYQMTNTLPAGDIFVFQLPWFLRVSEGRILQGIKKDQPAIIVYEKLAIYEEQKVSDFAKDIDRYINQNYQKEDSVGTTEILRRKAT